jgi:hypothetical protein
MIDLNEVGGEKMFDVFPDNPDRSFGKWRRASVCLSRDSRPKRPTPRNGSSDARPDRRDAPRVDQQKCEDLRLVSSWF